MNTYIYTSDEMHCTACVVMMEEELIRHDLVKKVVADAAKKQVIVEGDFGELTAEDLRDELVPLVSEFGYTLRVHGAAPADVSLANSKREWVIAGMIAYLFLSVIFVLERANLFGVVAMDGKLPLPSVFMIGVLASVSSCMAVVGGLVIAISNSYAKNGATKIPQVAFHAGRIISFIIGGAMLGYVGSMFSLGYYGTIIVNAIIAALMLLLGLNLLGVSWAARLIPTLPKAFGSKVLAGKKLEYRYLPFLMGAATFFLPCGFTQAMQFAALSSGDPLRASSIMFVFALGTLPMLAALSFGSRLVKKSHQGIFFKTAGLLVIGFALLNLRGVLTLSGIL